MSIPVKKTERFGLPVYLSKNAEEGRKAGCLCVHKENGKYVYCRRMEGNLRLQKKLTDRFGEIGAKKRLRYLAVLCMRAIFTAETAGIFNQRFSRKICPIALINYEICRAANMAFATAWCPGYIPSDGQTVSKETK
jgi:hypothetical protein